MLKATWSILNGLALDIPCDISEEILANLSNGVFADGNTVYYIPSSRGKARELIRSYIEGYMNQCVSEHKKVLEQARNDWKSCK